MHALKFRLSKSWRPRSRKKLQNEFRMLVFVSQSQGKLRKLRQGGLTMSETTMTKAVHIYVCQGTDYALSKHGVSVAI